MKIYTDNITFENRFLLPFYLMKIKYDQIHTIKKCFKNWIDIILFRQGFIKQVTVEFDGKHAILKTQNDYMKLWGRISEGGRLKIGTTAYKFAMDNMRKEYSWLKVKDRVIVDIGANIGDSSIYFATQGAKKVYSYEPYPYAFKKAKQNSARFGTKIKIFNQGVGSSTKRIKLDANKKYSGGSNLKASKVGKEIKITTLKDIVESHNLRNAILKIDCEGHEYEILLNSDNDTLNRFDAIVLEYHFGYANLAERLKKAGFKVSYTPALTHPTKDGSLLLGLMYARK